MSTIRPEDHPALPVLILAAVFLAFGYAAPTRATLWMWPRTLMEGQGMRLECRIPRHADNRYAKWGIVDVTSSERWLQGERAPATFPERIAGVSDPAIVYPPEGNWTAFCEVWDRHGKQFADRAPLTVIGRGF